MGAAAENFGCLYEWSAGKGLFSRSWGAHWSFKAFWDKQSRPWAPWPVSWHTEEPLGAPWDLPVFHTCSSLAGVYKHPHYA